MEYKSKLIRTGSSTGVIIPKLFLDNLGWKLDDNIKIVYDRNRIIIRK